MRQVRKKATDPSLRKYLLKASQEGIKLSWDRYENMLPQDGFSQLGLTCFDCLLGPCRLNPFSREEEHSICGLTRDSLVYRNIERFIANGEYRLDRDDLAAVSKAGSRFAGLAHCYIEKMRRENSAEPMQESSRQIGLGLLKQDHVNLCLENLSVPVLHIVEEQIQRLQEEAARRGARGFNVVLAGDISPFVSFNSICNAGSTEFAVLTGLLDGYIVGQGGLGLGRNVIPHYHTFYADSRPGTDHNIVQSWLIQAAEAYSKRDQSKILAAEECTQAQIADINPEMLDSILQTGEYQGICILGGGSNLKLTQDALVCAAIKQMAQAKILTLSYGNTAVTLGKYGYFDHSAKSDQYPLAFCVGSESHVFKVIDLVESISSRHKVIALFPELCRPGDLILALALAGMGVKVFTAVNLPLEGSKEIKNSCEELITYSPPEKLLQDALILFSDSKL